MPAILHCKLLLLWFPLSGSNNPGYINGWTFNPFKLYKDTVMMTAIIILAKSVDVSE